MVDARPVPKVLHQIWLQGAAALQARPDVAVLCKQAERAALADGWRYRLWSDADLLLLPEYAESRHLANCFAHLADLGRYALLFHEGGLYVDVDTEMARMPNDTGPNGPFVGAWVMDGNNAAMAGPPGHEYFRRLLREAKKPEHYVGVAHQVNLCMEWAGPDVKRWEHKWWHGGWKWRYGNHLMDHAKLGSNIPLGDTFPPGATL
jgi:mannosyltransferase OCH1-like enzyme